MQVFRRSAKGGLADKIQVSNQKRQKLSACGGFSYEIFHFFLDNCTNVQYII
jgi:hypothetical protein